MENTQKINQTLTASIFEVFEKMYYIFLEPVGNSGWKQKWMASIKFVGPMEGEIKVLFSSGMADAMVQNMLNIEQSKITEKLVEDCLKEAVNMICGNFLRKFDASKVFNLSLPCFASSVGVENKTDKSSGYNLRLDFEAGEGMLGLIITAS